MPYHADDHHYARDVHFDPIHPHQLLPDMATHYYAEDMRPHLSEERHTYSGEAKEHSSYPTNLSHHHALHGSLVEEPKYATPPHAMPYHYVEMDPPHEAVHHADARHY